MHKHRSGLQVDLGIEVAWTPGPPGLNNMVVRYMTPHEVAVVGKVHACLVV